MATLWIFKLTAVETRSLRDDRRAGVILREVWAQVALVLSGVLSA